MSKEIALSRGLFAIVDAEDFEALSQHKWYAHSTAKGARMYAARRVGNGRAYMHRVIMGKPEVGDIDHINGNPLDNRRSNLRIVTRAENCRNTSRNAGSGATYDITTGKWMSLANWDGTRYMLGRYATKAEAMAASQGLRRLLKRGFRLIPPGAGVGTFSGTVPSVQEVPEDVIVQREQGGWYRGSDQIL
jgi:hypothetical protein